MKHLQRVFRVLGNPRRMAMVQLLLKRRELSVTTIAHSMGLSLTATSKHLIALAAVDLLDKRQESLTVYYRVVSDPTPEIRKVIQLISSSST